MGEYEVGLVCLNGHPVNGACSRFPEFDAEFCPECGQKTIRQCPECNSGIRGYYSESTATSWDPGAYCHNCGKPYPWTQRRTEALAEALDELDDLTAEERDKLKKSIPDILAETPKSGTAALRFKKAVAKVGTVGGKILTDVLTKVAVETVKKSIGF